MRAVVVKPHAAVALMGEVAATAQWLAVLGDERVTKENAAWLTAKWAEAKWAIDPSDEVLTPSMEHFYTSSIHGIGEAVPRWERAVDDALTGLYRGSAFPGECGFTEEEVTRLRVVLYDLTEMVREAELIIGSMGLEEQQARRIAEGARG